MHVHASALEFLTTVAYMLIAGYLFFQIKSRYPDSAVGKALAVITG